METSSGYFIVNATRHLLISPLVTFPGETGEKVETEREEVSEGAETQEEETGEAVDLLAAAEIGVVREGRWT